MNPIVQKDIFLRLEGDRNITFIGKKTQGIFLVEELHAIIRTRFLLEPCAYLILYERSGRKNIKIRTQEDLDLAFTGLRSTSLDLRLCGRKVSAAVQSLLAIQRAEMTAAPPNSVSPGFVMQYNALQGIPLNNEPAPPHNNG